MNLEILVKEFEDSVKLFEFERNQSGKNRIQAEINFHYGKSMHLFEMLSKYEDKIRSNETFMEWKYRMRIKTRSTDQHQVEQSSLKIGLLQLASLNKY